jgi:oligopeptide/dipeptide ABC transporter ATP-binding protein
MSLLEAKTLSREFKVGPALAKKTLRAVIDVSLSVEKGQTLGLVGESGSGKTTLGRLLLGLLKPTSGSVRFDGKDLGALAPAELRTLRRQFQMVFQDPLAALNPRVPILDAVREPLEIHEPQLSRAEADAKAAAMLERVGLPPAMHPRLPRALSGGQRQRAVIARALVAGPSLIVADEPVSALDVSVQAQVVNLLADLKTERGLAMLFISHDLSVVGHLADAVAVLYLGRVVEQAPKAELFATPRHPYTQALLSAAPAARAQGKRIVLDGDPASPLAPPTGCAFHPRCPLYKTVSAEAQARCRGEVPPLRPLGAATVACHHADR